MSAVVLMELRAGITNRRSERALDDVLRAYGTGGRLVAPSARVLDDAGRLLRQLRVRGRDVRKASLVHDVLIALSTRSVGGVLYTKDGSDFRAIQDLRSFELEIVV